jgi:3-oxoacyl-[acyl-carrier-protein] synthase III
MSFFTIPGELLSFTVRKLVEHARDFQPIASRVHDIIIGHAVSVPTTSRVVKLLQLDPGRVFETHARFGNTVSASLPLALAVAEAEGRLHRGMRVCLLMGSAGVSTAVGSFTY